MNCSVCQKTLTGGVVATKNKVCPFAGHWIHDRCQGLNAGSLVSICSVCRRLGSNYVRGVCENQVVEFDLGEVQPLAFGIGNVSTFLSEPEQGNLVLKGCICYVSDIQIGK